MDLATGWLTGGDSKTDAGRRRVKIRGALTDELLSVRSPATVGQDAYVFPTRTGARVGADTFRNRVLALAVKRTNENLERAELPPLPDKLTPTPCGGRSARCCTRSGRRRRWSWREMGHTDPALALRVYAQAMRRDESQQAQLRALAEGADWANMGQRDAETPADAAADSPRAAVLQALRP